MKVYKANTVQWTNENGFETTDNIVIGKLYRNPNPNEAWTIAWEIEKDTETPGVKQYMVDKDTVAQVEAQETTDSVGKVMWYEEVNHEL